MQFPAGSDIIVPDLAVRAPLPARSNANGGFEMSVKITATSTCDLPAQLLERYQITMVPLYVSFGGGT